MQSYWLGIMAVVIGLLAPAAHAQRPDNRGMVGVGTVTILTDGIAEPRSQAAQAVNELAGPLSEIGKMRVLPIAGRGAAANVRDLLYLRGIDLAILNSDVLAFLDETRQYPDARRRIRYVTHLLDQQIYLLVRKEFGAIEDLRGRCPPAGAAIRRPLHCLGCKRSKSLWRRLAAMRSLMMLP